MTDNLGISVTYLGRPRIFVSANSCCPMLIFGQVKLSILARAELRGVARISYLK